MSSEDDALRAPLANWFSQRDPEIEDLEVGEIEQPKSGFSAKTIFVPLSYRRRGKPIQERRVVRLENPEPAIYPRQVASLDVEIDVQYRSMEALIATGKIPLAPVFGYEPDASILGQPFFAMGYVEGDVMIENPPYTQAGFFADAQPAEREAIITNAVHAMADFHTIDWRSAGFDWLVPEAETPSLGRQVDLWQTMAERELQGRVHPDLDQAFRFLRDHAPTGLEPGLSWGDSRPGNIIFEESRCACLTDFENIAVAPIEIDLGYWLLFDRTMHESVSTERLPGEPTREEQRAIYAEHSGRRVSDTYYFEVFGGARYAAIVVRVMNRLVERGQLPADQMVWLNNPAAAALGQLLRKSAGG